MSKIKAEIKPPKHDLGVGNLTLIEDHTKTGSVNNDPLANIIQVWLTVLRPGIPRQVPLSSKEPLDMVFVVVGLAVGTFLCRDIFVSGFTNHFGGL